MSICLQRPTAADWQLTVIATLVFGAFSAAFGLATGLFDPSIPNNITDLLRVAAIAFVLPALLEEFVFRGPIIWLAMKGSRQLLVAAMISLVLFVLWHPLNGTFLVTDAKDMFTDSRFLTIATMLGIIATWLAMRTRSLWPPVVFHWLAVVGWKALLGGPAFL